MNDSPLPPEVEVFNRRKFCVVSGVAALATLAAPRANAEAIVSENETNQKIQTGNGEWTYEVVTGWGQLPAEQPSEAPMAPSPQTGPARCM